LWIHARPRAAEEHLAHVLLPVSQGLLQLVGARSGELTHWHGEHLALLLQTLHGARASGIGDRLGGRALDGARRARLCLANRLAVGGALAGGLAHDINNPLACMVGNLDFLSRRIAALEGELPAERHRELVELARGATHGAERVHSIARALRHVSCPDPEPPEPADLHEAVAVALLAADREVRRCATVVKALQPVPRVRASRAVLLQIVLNLILNATAAIAATHRAGELTVRTLPDSHGRAVLEVEDTGSGIPEAALVHVLEPFFSTRPPELAAGLGLYACRQLVEQLDGALELGSGARGGCLLRVRLPGLPETSEIARTSAPEPGAARGRLLVVDDDAAVGRVIVRMLSPDHEVRWVASGRLALELLAAPAADFDVILCDLGMPDMSGEELLHAIEQLRPAYAERVILITGGPAISPGRSALRRAHRPVIEKPFDRIQLSALVQSRLEHLRRKPDS
jgi:signal transduction histidine kinase/CheY-like chemotaxis protein